MSRLIAAALPLWIGMVSYGQPDLSGHWTGIVRSGGAEAPLSIDITGDPNTPIVAITYERSGIRQGRLASAEWVDGALRAESRPGARHYTVMFTPDGPDQLTGTVRGGEFESHVSLRRGVWSPPYREEQVRFSNDDVALEGRLYIPDGAGPFPALVHLHGSGDGYIEDFVFWADYFARLGFASLVFDKRGCGGSGGNWRDVGFEALARDGLAAVEVLSARSDIDAARIGMTGISQAGWIMPLAASMSSGVAFLVIISGPSITVEEEGYYDYLIKLKDLGYSDEILREARAILEMDRAVLRGHADADSLRERVAAVRREPWFRDLAFTRSPVGGWYPKIMDYDPLPTLRQVSIPMLWVYGMEDRSVPPYECITLLEQLIDEHNKDYTIVRIPGADHGVRVSPDPAAAALPFRVYPAAYLDSVSGWLSERVLHVE